MKIFISHSWQNKSIATRIFEDLKKDGHDVWFDVMQLLPGDPIQKKIDEYISNSDTVVLVWSNYASSSSGVNAEIETAIRFKKRIIPLELDETQLQNHRLLKDLLGIQMIDYEMGILLLRSGLFIIMASKMKDLPDLIKKGLDNITETGGYLNYINTYRLKKNLNEDGFKKEWQERIENIFNISEYIKNVLLPQDDLIMKEMVEIVNQLEPGNAPLSQLYIWLQWCNKYQNFHPSMISKLRNIIEKNIAESKGF